MLCFSKEGNVFYILEIFPCNTVKIKKQRLVAGRDKLQNWGKIAHVGTGFVPNKLDQ